MCGIAGFIDPSCSEPQALSRLSVMLALIAHRGPDGEGQHVSPGLAMGMRRLSIIDLEGGAQPIWNEDRSIGIVFNGEIYNFLELRKELSSHQFSTHTDTEVLVHLYEEHGLEMLHNLRGMFAFALLDTRRKRLVLARDHFGQKPLYYFAHGGRFAFASELKCLLSLSDAPRERNDAAFFDYISWLSLPPPGTHFRHIFKLPAGSYIDVSLDDPEHPAIRKYWSYDLTTAPDLTDEAKAIDQLDHALRESVALHLRADVPVGVLLSSGLDSRCVASYAQEITGGSLSTFSVGFPGEDSELAGAAETAREIGTRHHAVELHAKDFSESIERIAWHLDEPVGDSAAFAVLKVCEYARQHVKVLLSGEGSDELFGGYDARYRGMLHTLARSDSLRRIGFLLPSRPPTLSPNRWQRLCDRVHLSHAAESISLRVEGMPGDLRHPRGLSVQQLSQLRARKETLAATLFRPQRDRLSELLMLDLEWQLAESLLQKADKMSMGASIELRTPLLDRGVASIAARIPSRLKLPQSGPGKWILRRCMSRRLVETANRQKKGFPIPLRSWFSGHLRDPLESALFDQHAACLQYLDKKLLRAAWDDFLKGEWEGAALFYALWLYEVWHAQLSAKVSLNA